MAFVSHSRRREDPVTDKILVSACLLGRPVRYNGSAKSAPHPFLEQWNAQGRLVSLCPELAAGFSVPRPPAEIADGRSGGAVLAGSARVIEATPRGRDDTLRRRRVRRVVHGARSSLQICPARRWKPSCGSGFIHDGSLTGGIHRGIGVTTALLQKSGIEVFAETQIDALHARLSQIA